MKGLLSKLISDQNTDKKPQYIPMSIRVNIFLEAS